MKNRFFYSDLTNKDDLFVKKGGEISFLHDERDKSAVAVETTAS